MNGGRDGYSRKTPPRAGDSRHVLALAWEALGQHPFRNSELQSELERSPVNAPEED